MTRNKLISSLLIAGVLAASVSNSALAGDRGRGGGGGNNNAGVAIAAGILGAVVIGSLIANSQPTYAAPQPYYQPQPQPVYVAPPQTYYPAPPRPIRQTYYAAPQPYYAPAPAIVIDSRYRPRDRYYHSH